ncbi:hypothetical protein KC354_g7685 [Hortaea werneckii]|nr:hypothetical protein KC354_g7685 [Hortaea werneckii]
MTSINQAFAPEEHQDFRRGRERGDEEDVENEASEQTPLLPADAQAQEDRSQPQRETSARRSLLSSLHTTSSGKGSKRRWPSLIALGVLCVVAILIIIFAFLAPSTVQQYAQQAVVFDPTSLSIDSLTTSGVRARIQGDFMMDASRVQKKNVRNLGKFFTGIARQAESGESKVEVSLPEYGNVVLGTAHVPGVKVDLRDGYRTHVDILSDLEPGDLDDIRRIANDWVDGRLGQLRVLGKANVPLKSGIVSLGKQIIRQELLFANKDIPSIPAYDIKKLNFREIELPQGGKGMAADASIVVENPYPVDSTVPPLAFNALVDNCHREEPYIKVAEVEAHELHVRPKQELEVNITGVVRQLPDILLQDCPNSDKSPLDLILGKYLHGKDTTVYVQGSEAPQFDTPDWVTKLLSSITVPVPLPGRTFGHLIKDFNLADTHFALPDPFADDKDPRSNPRFSSKVQATVALPEEMNFNISISHVRADADVFYKGKKLGELDLHKWQKANSTRQESSKHDGPTLAVESKIEDAPLKITDNDVFTDVIQALVFGGKSVLMHIKADVDVELETALGEMVVRKIPAEGEVPVKPISSSPSTGKPPGHGNDKHGKDLLGGFRPKVFDLNILDTTSSGFTLSALINMTNPTNYSATIPYVDIHISNNGSLLGHATIKDLELKPGNNTRLPIQAVWDPLTLGGGKARGIGRELLSQYVSGYNTTLTLQTHRGSIPGQPSLGEALARFPIELPTPRLGSPRDDDDNPDEPPPDKPGKGGEDESPHFIEDATMHLFTSTADFMLLSPLRKTTLFVTDVDATAYYKGDEVAQIQYSLPFEVPPVGADGKGIKTPRLPVDWSIGSVGYDAVKNALGGSLRMSAFAWVGVRVGRFEERIWFRGRGIGASIRL